MNRARLRSRLLTVAFVVLVALAWWYLAPTKVGGSTRYVVTSGISMEPRFHRGDLALVRAEDTYRVGEIVAYHSTLLHVTVLHRIIGRDGNRYVFKGDNNHFIDPTHPTRAELLGALWLHVPRAGVALKLLHSPVGAATLCALVGLVLLLGGRREQRRRRRRRAGPASGAGRPGAASMKAVIDHDARRPLNWNALLTASAIAGAVFVVIGLFALTRPAHKPSAVKTPYVQRVTFAYSARVHPGAVYPTGLIHTGDPIFPQLVHRLDLHLDYRLTSAAPHAVRGTEDVVLQLTGPGGWNRQIVLAPRTAFDADHTSTDVTLDLPYVESLFQQVARVTGVLGGTYTVAVEPRVHVIGTVAGDAVQTSYAPSLRFQLNATQLLPSGGSSTSGGSSSGFSQQQSASVGTPATAANAFKIGGVSVEIPLLRWISLIGLLLSAVASAFFYLRKRGEPFEETFRIQAQYGHLIVPIVGGEDLGWPPVDVPSIKALVRLAESGQRLILHSRSNDIDTYLVNDEGTVYRYQVKPSKVIWGEWSETAEPVKLAA